MKLASLRTAVTATFAGALLVAAGGCLSVPLSIEPRDDIAAIGWLSDSETIALAHHTSVYRGWYPLSPDGTGVMDTQSKGHLVLLASRGRVTVDYSPSEIFWIRKALFVPSLKAFLVLLDFPDEHTVLRTECLLVSPKGASKSCLFPDGLPNFSVSPDGRSIFTSTRFGGPAQRYDYLTGASTTATSPLERVTVESLEQFPSWMPCTHSLSSAALAPGGSLLAITCDAPRDIAGLWFADARGNVHQAFPFSSRQPALTQHFVLAWAPNQEFVYLADAPAGSGYVIPVADNSVKAKGPSLLNPVWAPDSRRLAGVHENHIVVWNPFDTASSMVVYPAGEGSVPNESLQRTPTAAATHPPTQAAVWVR